MMYTKFVFTLVVLVLLLTLTSVTLAQENQPDFPQFIKSLSERFTSLQAAIQEKALAAASLSPASDQSPVVAKVGYPQVKLFVHWIQNNLVRVESALAHPLQTLHLQPVRTTALTHITLPDFLKRLALAQNGKELVSPLKSLLHQLVTLVEAAS